MVCFLLCFSGAALAGNPGSRAPLVIEDDVGRTLTVTQPFTRIIPLYGAHTENLFTLGAADAVAGVTRHDSDLPAAQNKAVFSYHDGLERFLAAGPDLVLVRPMIDRGYAPLVQGLEKHGIPVLSLQPGTVEEMMAYWRTLGALSGRRMEAERMIRAFRQAVADFPP